jgi:hypothetical protein
MHNKLLMVLNKVVMHKKYGIGIVQSTETHGEKTFYHSDLTFLYL